MASHDREEIRPVENRRKYCENYSQRKISDSIFLVVSQHLLS